MKSLIDMSREELEQEIYYKYCSDLCKEWENEILKLLLENETIEFLKDKPEEIDKEIKNDN